MISHDDDMLYEEDMKAWQKGVADLFSMIVVITLCVVAFFLVSCSTHKVVEQTRTVDSTTIVRNDKTDSVAIKTVFQDRFIDRYIEKSVVVNTNGDTVKEKIIDRLVQVTNREQHDSITFLQAKVDSLSNIKTRTEIKTAEKSLSWWERFILSYYIYTTIALLIIIAYMVLRNRLRFIKFFHKY